MLKKLFPPFQYMNLPNGITFLAVAAGSTGLFLTLLDHYKLGLLVYALTFILDVLDGMMARKLNLQSQFGIQMDSIADFGNFCLIPAIFVFTFAQLNLWMLLAMLPYIIAGAMRLAYYNLTGVVQEGNAVYYTGLPTTAAAMWVYIVMVFNRFIFPQYAAMLLSVGLLILTALMVCKTHYRKHGFAFFLLLVFFTAAVALVVFT